MSSNRRERAARPFVERQQVLQLESVRCNEFCKPLLLVARSRHPNVGQSLVTILIQVGEIVDRGRAIAIPEKALGPEHALGQRHNRDVKAEFTCERTELAINERRCLSADLHSQRF